MKKFIKPETKEEGNFSGFVMRRDETVAGIVNGEVTEISEKAPIYLKRTGEFNKWLSNRGADLKRSNMRVIMRHLGLPLLDVLPSVYLVNAASITDEFWIKGYAESLTYDKVAFKTDIYFKASLNGDPDLTSKPKERSPEITNIGSFEKGWKRKEGKWHLYKEGNEYQQFSELFTSKLALELGLDAVECYIDDGFIVCESFVGDNESLEHAIAIVGTDINYERNVEKFKEYGLEKKYFDIIFMDAIVKNMDRHQYNYGVITRSDNDTVKMAPNYDNNKALFSSGEPKSPERNDDLVGEFAGAAKKYGYEMPKISEKLVEKVYEETAKECTAKISGKKVIDFCVNAYKGAKEIIEA